MCQAIGNVFRLIIVGGCGLGLTLQWLNMYSCDFFSFADTNESIGIWYESFNGGTECFLEEPYAAADDTIIAGARSAAIISMVCGFVAGVLVFIEWVCCNICCAGCVEGLAFFGAWTCSVGVFMLYGIEECGTLDADLAGNENEIVSGGAGFLPDGIPTGTNCEWGQGATYQLIASIAYFGCAILMCFAPEPKPLCSKG